MVGALAFVALYAVSLGPVMWLYNVEIMPAAGISVATFLNWVFTLGVSFSTPILMEGTPGPAATFWIYAGFCFAGCHRLRSAVSGVCSDFHLVRFVRTWIPLVSCGCRLPERRHSLRVANSPTNQSIERAVS